MGPLPAKADYTSARKAKPGVEDGSEVDDDCESDEDGCSAEEVGFENDMIHPYLKKVFAAVCKVAQSKGVKCNKYHHELREASSSAGSRIDFAFTTMSEQLCQALNILFVLEAKVLDEGPGDAKLREGLAQVINRFVHHRVEQLKAGVAVKCAYGVACTGKSIVFAKVKFEAGRCPLYIVPFADLKSPEALTCLVKLVTETDVTKFGLPEPASLAPDGFEYAGLLGTGGFADVSCAVKRDTGQRFAVKWLRKGHSADQVALEKEHEIVTTLIHASVPGVSTSCELTTLPVNGFPALLMAPVGMPLVRYVKTCICGCVDTSTCEERTHWPDRKDLALKLYNSLKATLAAAHSKGIFHCDIRPHNIIVVEEGTDRRFVLIDWGLAVATRDPVPTPYGVPAFLSNAQVRAWSNRSAYVATGADDDAALLFTYLAIRGGDERCGPLWHLTDPIWPEFISMRATWLRENVAEKLEEYPEDIRDALRGLCDSCADEHTPVAAGINTAAADGGAGGSGGVLPRKVVLSE